jgi:ABC-type bacteriocin/lantibiotic exporter with double-glycine peptidase domain
MRRVLVRTENQMRSESIRSGGNLVAELKRLFGQLSKARRLQFYRVLIFAVFGAMSELLTLGAIMPLLLAMTDSNNSASSPLFVWLRGLGAGSGADILFIVTVFFAAAAIVSAVLRVLIAWESQSLAFQVGSDLGVEVYRRTLCQPYLYHLSKNGSELLASITKIDQIVYGALNQLMQMIGAFIIACFLVAALIAIDPIVAISLAIGFGTLYLGVTRAMRHRLEKSGEEWANVQGKRLKALQEGLGGIRDILLHRTQRVFVEDFRDADSRFRRAQATGYFIGTAPRYLIEAGGMVLIVGVAVILSLGKGGLVVALPVLGALALGAQRLLPLLQQMYYGWSVIEATRPALRQVLDFLELPVDSSYEQAADVKPIPFKRSISLTRVRFQYSVDGAVVLPDVSLDIPAGARVGVIGKTGSGKSTLVDLVMGLLKPTSGMISIDDVALTQDNVRGWQAQIAHVPQSIYLADATIIENIAFGIPKQQIDHERIQAAVRQAKLDELIGSLPDGYETNVGERGVRLSGGQRQRIGIARALYREARVLVFDEATSALDNETEAQVMEAIQSLGRDLTILIIAHRLSTLKLCDMVVKFDSGQVIAERRSPMYSKAENKPLISVLGKVAPLTRLNAERGIKA